MHSQMIACSFQRHLEMKGHLLQHPTANGTDVVPGEHTTKDQQQVAQTAA